MATRNTNVWLKTYNWTTITQLGICKVKMEHNNKQKICNFFVILENGQMLLGMSDIEMLNIWTVNYNTVGTQQADRATKYRTNTDSCQGAGCEQHYSNTRQEAGRPGSCYTKPSSNSHFKIIVQIRQQSIIMKLIISFQAPTEKMTRVSAEITKQLQRDFEDVCSGIGCFVGTFYCR